MKTVHDEWQTWLIEVLPKELPAYQVENLKMSFYAGALIQLKVLVDLMEEESITAIKLRNTILDLYNEAGMFLESKTQENH
jgi:uncharacterized protein (DUF2344 family)